MGIYLRQRIDVNCDHSPFLLAFHLNSLVTIQYYRLFMPSPAKTYPNPGKAPEIFYDTDICPIRNVLGLLGRKWPSLILCHLSFGTHRFSELRGAIPDISQRMLAQTLRELDRDGLISRNTVPGVPPRVDYSLTPLGETYIEPLQNLLTWGAKHQGRINIIRRAYDEERQLQTAG